VCCYSTTLQRALLARSNSRSFQRVAKKPSAPAAQALTGKHINDVAAAAQLAFLPHAGTRS